MQTPRTCAHCGAGLSPEDRFCAACGHPVQASPPVEPEPEPDAGKKMKDVAGTRPGKRRFTRKFLLYGILPLFLLASLYLLALILWNATYGNALYRQRAISVAFAPSGALLAGGCADGRVIIWDVTTGKVHSRFQASERAIAALAFGPKVDALTCWDADGTICLMDLNSRKRIAKASRPREKGGAVVALSQDLGTAAVRLDNEKIMLLDPIRGNQKRIIGADSVYCLSLSKDGRLLAMSQDWDLVFFNCRTGKRLHRLEINGLIDAMGFSPDSRTLAVGGYKKNIIMFDVSSGMEKQALPGTGIFLSALAFTPEGDLLAAAGGSGGGTWGISLYDLNSGQKTKIFRQAPLWQRVLAIAGF